MSKINIAFSINDNHCLYVFFTISMIKKYTNNLDIFVLHTDLSDKSKDRLKTLETESVNIHFVTIDRDLFSNLPLTLDGITIETYYRYLLPEILVDCDKVIYLDSDLLIRCDVKELWDIDLSQHYLAGVNEIDIINRFPDHKLKLGFDLDELFINAGVLVCNLQKMRQDKITHHLFTETERLKDIILFQDQDVINIALKGKIAELPLAYNYTVEAMEKDLLGLDEIKIIHYNSPGAKPWKHYQFQEQPLNKYLKLWQVDFVKNMKQIQQTKVSLLLPIYNETSLTTIEKICKQSYKNIQLILLNYDPEMTIQMEDIRSKSLLDSENIVILNVDPASPLGLDLLKLVKGQYLISLNHIDELDDRLLEKAIDSAEKYQSEIVLMENCIFDENDGNYYFYNKLFDEEILRAETVKTKFQDSPRHQNYLTNNYAKLFKTSYVKENHINLTQDFTPETYNTDKISYVKENLYVYKKVKEELVSVIVPVYNVEKYLSQCLDSIIHQTYKNLEIILVNDGSTDGSGKICDDYAAKDGRIKVIHQENGGLSDARNKGLDLMTGQFVTFVDSDDYLENNCIHTLYTYAYTCKTDISIGKFIEFEENTSQFLFHNHLNNGNKIEFLTGDQCLERHHKYFLSIFVTAWAKLYRTSLFNDSNPCKKIRYPLGVLHEDQYTTHKLFFKSNKIVFVNDYLYVYRVRKNSITNTPLSDKRIMDNIRGLEEKIIDFCLLNKDMTLLREHYLFYLNNYKAYLENNHRQNSAVYEFIQKRLGTYSNWK
ncbi:TPA: glycosyltransferase [Streptococcus suis]|nr:glycosyltransferase [Streptococcus suis]HEM6014985.1 glycosyltransferase [Streptococcus suis]HEM6030390.1 glycosyltransferase [Streptococcus suis]HEM6352817.1 glycosyltransferase [Streptococcus suis]HEM6374456.1 glycosyltransferase [Streptococcus suis]